MIKVGDSVPELSLKVTDGETTSLTDYHGEIIVLYFYPRDNTPGCTTQACAFRDNYDEFKQLNATIIGVSPDSLESHTSFKDKHDLPFPLVADDNHELAEHFGVWKLKKRDGKEYFGVERSTFIIDRSGIVSHVFPKVNVIGHVKEVMDAIKEIED